MRSPQKCFIRKKQDINDKLYCCKGTGNKLIFHWNTALQSNFPSDSNQLTKLTMHYPKRAGIWWQIEPFDILSLGMLAVKRKVQSASKRWWRWGNNESLLSTTKSPYFSWHQFRGTKSHNWDIVTRNWRVVFFFTGKWLGNDKNFF